ncbi:hypothetical protein BDL97_01G207800 [Sphagnum fallax]|nr:hypothetical protein BDL97_01G207800 [Sphagnum fallax]
MCQRVHDKTDVYSFGVVLLELITGRKPIERRPEGETNLIAWARPLLVEKNLDKLVDLRLGSTYNGCQMQAMISAAALCVQQSSQHRPQISQVLKMLGKDTDGEEGLSTGGNSRPVYIADTTYVNHGACNSATSLLQQVQSIYFQRPSRRRFSFIELQASTGGFSAGNLVGKGDFNKVYRGELQDGRLVGIKCPRNSESQENFQGLEINSCLSHANIVSLIGYCVENTQLILVYDSLHQQTLSDHLHGEENVLGWEVRYKVAVGICKALEYLHDGSPRPVIHRNVKPSKILVSHNFQPKLSGLEFATWAPERSIHQADKVFGTIGYLDPEYAITGKFSDKSDVYSFGVVLVELITGRKVKDGTRPQGEQYLMAWARPLLDKRNLDELVDPQLGKTYNVSQMQAMILAAALCVQQSSQ